MNSFRHLLLLLPACLLVSCATQNPPPADKTVPHGQAGAKPLLESSEMNQDVARQTYAFKLGDDKIEVAVRQKPPGSPTMVNVHHDEQTSVEAGLANVKQNGGRLIELVHPGARLVAFRLDGQLYTFDPNRIFSDAGINATLRKFGAWSPAAHDAVKSFATEYLNHFALDREPVIIALHNTTDGIFSVKSYLPNAEYGSSSTETHVSPRRSQFDFFFATDRRFFDYLKARDFNVILQDNQNTPDDGSLSVYFGHKGVPYLNIEAEMSHLQNQIEMVNVAREMVDEIILKPRKP